MLFVSLSSFMSHRAFMAMVLQMTPLLHRGVAPWYHYFLLHNRSRIVVARQFSAPFIQSSFQGDDRKARQYRVPYTQRRLCFHPGSSNLNRETLGIDGGKSLTTTQLLKELGQFVWPDNRPDLKKRVIASCGLLLGAKVVNVCVPLMLGRVVNHFDTSGIEQVSGALVTTGAAMIVGYGIARTTSALFNEMRNAVFAQVSHASTRQIARNVFLHMHNLDLDFHLSRHTGALAKAVDRGTRGINFILSALVFNILPTSLELVFVLGILSYKYGTEYAGLTLACTGVYALFTLMTTQWRTQFRIDMNQADQQAGNVAIDSLINFETVKYFNNELLEADRYDRFLKTYEKSSLATTKSLAFLNWGQNFIVSASMAACMTLAAVQMGVAGSAITAGDLIVINGLLFQLSIPLGFLGSVYRETRQAHIDMEVVFKLMQQSPKIVDSPTAVTVFDEANRRLSAPPSLGISFKDVKFAYPTNRESPILNGLTFDVLPGQKVAIVGGSGSGKSTIVRLLYRFYELDEGSISINDANLTNIKMDNLRQAISIVPQDCVLFHDTIAYNIRYGDPTATEDEVLQVSKDAELHEMIESFPKKYETEVGERGLKLSGGEKQRIAIARAVLKKSPILVYDEATSSLDSITEQKIMKSMERVAANKTMLIIAHRLSTIVNADKIIVLKKGRVVEQGTHSELLAVENGVYATLWQKQHEVALSGVTEDGKLVDRTTSLLGSANRVSGGATMNGGMGGKRPSADELKAMFKSGCDNCSC